MNVERGYYSLIQFCPDRERLEAANIGVVLFCPESGFLGARTARGNHRIRQFFGHDADFDWSQINTIKKSIEKRLAKEQALGELKNLEDLETFIAKRANQIQLTQPRPMKVFDPTSDLDQLFVDIIGEPKRRTKSGGLKARIEESFERGGVNDRIQRDICVEVPIFSKSVQIPYGFQNGRFNLITPVRFESGDPDAAVKTACRYAVEGESLYRHEDQRLGEMQLLVLGKFRAKDSASRDIVGRILGEHDVRLFDMVTLPELVDEIRHGAKPLANIAKD